MQPSAEIIAPASAGLSNIATQGILGSLVAILAGVVAYLYWSQRALHKDHIALKDQQISSQKTQSDALSSLQDAHNEKVVSLLQDHANQVNTLHQRYQSEIASLQKSRLDDAQALAREGRMMMESTARATETLARAIDTQAPPTRKPR